MTRDLFQCDESWLTNSKPWPNGKYFACQLVSIACLLICVVCVSIGSKFLHDASNIEPNCTTPVRPFPRQSSSDTTTDCLSELSRKNSLLYTGYTLCTVGMFFGMGFGALAVMICCKGCHQLPAERERDLHHGRANSVDDEDLPTLPSYSDVANQSVGGPTVHNASPTPCNDCHSFDF